MVRVVDIISINRAGWILLHLKSCQYCVDVRKKVGVIKWKLMNKQECSTGGCPTSVNSYPTWYNIDTGETWDGVGVFR
jgi:hypothetical protein